MWSPKCLLRSDQSALWRAQNLVLAFGSILALALPALLGFIPLWAAVALHEGSTVLVALNCTRLLTLSRRNWCGRSSLLHTDGTHEVLNLPPSVSGCTSAALVACMQDGEWQE